MSSEEREMVWKQTLNSIRQGQPLPPLSRPSAYPRTRRQAVYERFNGTCHWCGRKTLLAQGASSDPLSSTVDHVIPRWRGGTNEKDNLVLACHACNQRRNKEDHCGLEEGALLRQPIPVPKKPKKATRTSGGHIALTADEKALLMARVEAGDRTKWQSQMAKLREEKNALQKELEEVRDLKGTADSNLHLARTELAKLQSDWDNLTLLKFLRMRLL